MNITDEYYHFENIKNAYKALKSHRYLAAVSSLQRVINRKRDIYSLYLMAISYLLLNKFNETEKIINQIKYIDPLYNPLKELEAFLFLKSASNPEEVLLKYYDLEQIGKNKKLYKKIINKIQNSNSFEVLQKKILLFQCIILPKPNIRDYIEFDKMNYSPTKNKLNKKFKLKYKIITILCIFFITLIIFLFNKYNYITIKNLFFNKYKIEADDDFKTLDDNKYPIIDKIVREKTNIFYYSENELKHDFTNIQHLIKNKKYNNALILINKINNSNANLIVKEKINFFKSIVLNAKDRKISSFTYNEVIKKPYLFNGVMILWEGRISNLKISNNKYIFTMLINYQNKDIFSGIAKVFYEKRDEKLKNGDLIKIKAIFTEKIINALEIKKLQ